MSALRISRPGYPTELVVLEPAVGRITHTRGAVYGGTIVVGGKPSKAITTVSDARKAQMAAYRSQAKVRCPKILRQIGEQCGRSAGHRDSCRSVEVMAADARRRRSQPVAA